jgi:hypothetical protein
MKVSARDSNPDCSELSSPSATVATFATIHPAIIGTVASVANVADLEPNTAFRVVLPIDVNIDRNKEDGHAAFGERTCILEVAE